MDVIELSDDEDEVPQPPASKKGRFRRKKSPVLSDACQSQPLERRKQPVRRATRGRAAEQKSPEVVYLDSPEAPQTDSCSRLNQDLGSNAEAPASLENKTKLKGIKGGRRGRPRKTKALQLENSERCLSEVESGRLQQAQASIALDGGPLEDSREDTHNGKEKTAQPLSSQTLSTDAKANHRGSCKSRKSAAKGRATGDVQDELSHHPLKKAKVAPTPSISVVQSSGESSPGVIHQRSSGGDSGRATGPGLSADCGVVEQQLPRPSQAGLTAIEGDDDDDDDFGLFDYGRNKAPRPDWNALRAISCGEQGKLESPSRKHERPGGEAEEVASDNPETSHSDCLLIQDLLGGKDSQAMPQPSRKKRGESKENGKRQSKRTQGQAAKNKNNASALDIKAELAARDAATEVKLAELRKRADALNSVKASLATGADASKLLAEASLTPPEKFTFSRTVISDDVPTKDGNEKGKDAQEADWKSDLNAGDKAAEKILLKVATASLERTWRISKDEELGNLFQAFSRSTGIDLAKLKFSFDGAVLTPSDTPEDKDLEDEDKIDATVLP